MSTRGEILWREKDINDKGKIVIRNIAQIYRNSDSYPSAMLQNFKEFFEWNVDRNFDPEYAVANFIYYMKQQMVNLYGEVNGNIAKLGYGVVPIGEIDYMVEWVYRITVDQIDKKIIIEVSENSENSFKKQQFSNIGTIDELLKDEKLMNDIIA